MARSELVKSVKAAVAAAAVVFGLYFIAAAVALVIRSGDLSRLRGAAWIFGSLGAVYLVLLLLFLVPLLQWLPLRRLGAAFSAPVAFLLALVSIVAFSIYVADNGDPSTVAGVVAAWRSRPWELFLYCMPYWVAVAVFPWVRRRLGRAPSVGSHPVAPATSPPQGASHLASRCGR